MQVTLPYTLPFRGARFGELSNSGLYASACRRLVKDFPIIHIVNWQDGSWLGLDDAAL